MNQARKRWGAVGAAIVVTVLSQGCTKENAGAGTGADCAEAGVFNFVLVDYATPLERTPAAFVAGKDIPLVVSGIVDEVVAGPAVPALNEPGTPQEELYVAVKIRVDKELVASDRSRIHDGFVYVITPRGPYSGPDWTPYPLNAWNRAVPKGTRVVAFLATPWEKLDDAFTGRWERTRPLAGVRNGLVLESCDQVLNTIDGASGPGWDFASLEELETAVGGNH